MEALMSLIQTMFIAFLLAAGVCGFCYIQYPKFRELILSILWSVFICGISFMLALIYLISPIDAIPDPIPLLGQLDDLGVFTAAVLTIPIRIIYTLKVFIRDKKAN